MPRPRFTLRWLMLAVAVAAVWFAYRDMSRRRREYNMGVGINRYWAFDSWESGKLSDLVEFGKPLPIEAVPPDRRATVKNYLRHLARYRKYERAARYPWLPVAPDPPEPE